MVDRNHWHRWFAWYPVSNASGKWVWCTRVLRRWNPDLYHAFDFHGAYAVGGWEYLI